MESFNDLLREYNMNSTISAYEHSRQIVSIYFQNQEYLSDGNKRLEEMKKYIFFRAIRNEGFIPSTKEGVDGPLERLYKSLDGPKSDVNKILTVICNTKNASTRVNELESKFFRNAVYKSIKTNVPIDREALSEYLFMAEEKGLSRVQKERTNSDLLNRATNYYKHPLFTANEIDKLQAKNEKIFIKGTRAKKLQDSLMEVQNDLLDVTEKLLKDDFTRQKEAKLDPKKAPTGSYNRLIEAIKEYQKSVTSTKPKEIYSGLDKLKKAAEEYKAAHGGLRLSKGRERSNAASSIISFVDKQLKTMEGSYKDLTKKNISNSESPSFKELYIKHGDPYDRYANKLECMRTANRKYSEMIESIDKSMVSLQNSSTLTEAAKERFYSQIYANRIAAQIIAEEMKEKISKMDDGKNMVFPDDVKQAFNAGSLKKKISLFKTSGHFTNYVNHHDMREESLGYIKKIVNCKEANLKPDVPDPNKLREEYLLKQEAEAQFIKQQKRQEKEKTEDEMNNIKNTDPHADTAAKKDVKEQDAGQNIINEQPNEVIMSNTKDDHKMPKEENPFDKMFRNFADDKRYKYAKHLKPGNKENTAINNTNTNGTNSKIMKKKG